MEAGAEKTGDCWHTSDEEATKLNLFDWLAGSVPPLDAAAGAGTGAATGAGVAGTGAWAAAGAKWF